MCLAQGPQRSDDSEAPTCGPSVESSTLPLSHCAPLSIVLTFSIAAYPVCEKPAMDGVGVYEMDKCVNIIIMS